MKNIFITLLILLNYVFANAQSANGILKNHELSLIQLLEKDSGDMQSTIDNNEFQFGTDFKGATYSNIVKHKGKILIQPLGTGRLYEIVKENNTYRSRRIDSTLHSGVNFFSKTFFVRDTLYQFGGLGFWNIRGLLTFFSKQTNQWELVQTNRDVPCFFDNSQDAILQVYDNPTHPKIYLSNTYKYLNYPQTFDIYGKDTSFVFDFNTKQWTALGKLNPELKRILLGKNSLYLNFGKYQLIQSALEFYWINFETNSYGKLKPKYNGEIRQIWLRIYNNENNVGAANFQLNIGNNIYFFKVTKDRILEYEKYTFNEEMLDLNKQDYIYSNKTDFIAIITNFLDEYKTLLLTVLSLIALSIFIYSLRKRKKKLPKEVVTILNNNFFSALTIVEKELIEELYEHHLKGEELSTKLINKIIGVQQKDTLTQNKSRSDYFIRINQKFKMATQYSEPLIVKQRDHSDKRQYNYSLNNAYIADIENLLKN